LNASKTIKHVHFSATGESCKPCDNYEMLGFVGLSVIVLYIGIMLFKTRREGMYTGKYLFRLSERYQLRVLPRKNANSDSLQKRFTINLFKPLQKVFNMKICACSKWKDIKGKFHIAKLLNMARFVKSDIIIKYDEIMMIILLYLLSF
jgi:hypothetical protein